MSQGRRAVLAMWLTLCLSACGGGGSSSGSPTTGSPPPAPLPEPAPSKRFVDVTAASGIAYSIGHRTLPWFPEMARIATGGAAAGDYDNDGDIDLLITRGDVGPNLLYRNDGTGVFTDVAASAGLAFTAVADENYRHGAPAFADMDGDGDLDVFIGGMLGDPSFVFRNDGAAADYAFTDVTAGSGIDDLARSANMSAAFGDFDRDGFIDLFVTHWGSSVDTEDPGDTQHLWRNDTAGIGADIRFTSASIESGISPSIINLDDPLRIRDELDFTFSASFARIDDDLWPDLVVAADYNNSQVFLNRGDGSFENATDVGVIIDYNGMGSALGDYDNDGDLDWFVTAIYAEGDGSVLGDIGTLGNRLYENTANEPGTGVFADSTEAAGVADGGWGWGACAMDFENDGDLDIYHTNGWNLQLFDDDPSRAFVNEGNGVFVESAAALGLDDTKEGRGVVCADFDNDGDTDIFLLHRDFPVAATMWRNDGDANNFFKVELDGRAPNTQADGARIYATVGGETQMREIILGSNFLSQNPAVQVFGLGTETQVDELRIVWPDGAETLHGPYPAGANVVIVEP